jgi:hypothetical protein
MNDEEKAKLYIMTRLQNLIKAQGNYVMNDDLANTKSKLIQMDILLNVAKFLDNYDENIKILNEHIYNNRWQRERGDE